MSGTKECVFISGLPIAQPRVKASSHGGFTSVYTPQAKIKPWKKALASGMADLKPVLGPAVVTLRFFFERPKTHVKKKGGLRAGISEEMISKPDLDNLAKAVFDVMVEKRLLVDDSYIVKTVQEKLWVPPGMLSGVTIELTRIVR